MRIARESRGFEARDVRHCRCSRRSAGALFIRSYERGERVHLAMLSRGYAGSMPVIRRDVGVRGRSGRTRSLCRLAALVGCCWDGLAVTHRQPLLEVSRLAFAYPDGHQALFGVDLTIARGERVALLGPNGAGKTTLVLHLNGILTAGHGTVAVAGLPVRAGHAQGDPAAGRHRLPGPRRPALHADGPRGRRLRPGQPRAARRGAGRRASSDALERVGMVEFDDRPPHHLSFGQRRRVAVATVLAMEPEILVLDEPSSNLDPASRRELAEILRSLDVTVLMVTHDLPYALELCERSLILCDGVIAADGPTRELLADADLLARHRLELPYGFAIPAAAETV